MESGNMLLRLIKPCSRLKLAHIDSLSRTWAFKGALTNQFRLFSDKKDASDIERLKKEAYARGQPKLAKLFDQCGEEQKLAGEQNHDSWESDRNRLILIGVLAAAVGLGALYIKGGYPFDGSSVSDVSQQKKKSRIVTKLPPTSEEIPREVPYLLIGGGTASFSAFRAIKSADPLAKVLIISDEEHFPYMRPPLSKEMWFNRDKSVSKQLKFKQWNGKERSLLYEPEEFYMECKDLSSSAKGGVAVARGWKVIDLNVDEKTATLDDQTVIKFDKCLLATGASPKTLPAFSNTDNKDVADKVTLFRTVSDFERLDHVLDSAKSIAIVGNGFLGSELACALARYGSEKNIKIHQIFPESGNMTKILPEYLSHWTSEKVRSEGVNVIANAGVEKAESVKDGVRLSLSNGKQVEASHVVIAVGVEANTQLAQNARLETDPQKGGFLVNAELEARSNVYAAGDCACFYDVKLGRRRVSHHDHSVVSGRLAGENMAGSRHPYLHQSMFWSDLGPDIGYEAIGIVDSSLPTVGVFLKNQPADATSNSSKGISGSGSKEGNETSQSDTNKNTNTNNDSILNSNLIGNENDSKDYDSNSNSSNSNSKGSSSSSSSDDDYSKGVIFYLRDKKIVGLLMWNVFNRMSIARQILKSDQAFDDLNEVAKLFRLHED